MKKFFDVFNGDADGICALHQLRLAQPRPGAELVTGVKRDIRLLQQLAGIQNACITVLDISLDSNREALKFWEDYGLLLGAGLASLIYVLLILGRFVSLLPDIKSESVEKLKK